MEATIFLIIVSFLLFVILGLYDGFYLHIWKYQLYNHKESRFEHLAHTIRSILFPLLVYFLFLNNNSLFYFFIGLSIIILDLIVLAVDAYSEKESRTFMGGLPRGEYILHLFTNGFHFATIFLVLSTQISLQEEISFSPRSLATSEGSYSFIFTNALPGAIIMAILHLLLAIPYTRKKLDSYRKIVFGAASKK